MIITKLIPIQFWIVVTVSNLVYIRDIFYTYLK